MEGSLEIISIASTGKGCGFVMQDGYKKPYFVSYSCPGDKVTLKSVKAYKKYFEADVSEVVVKSKNRQEVTCPVYGVCGGCNLLHVKESFLVEEKAKILNHIFKSLRCDLPEINIVKNKVKFNYRFKSKIFFDSDELGNLKCGFKKKKSNDIVRVENCSIVHEKIRDLIDACNNADLKLEYPFTMTALVDFKSGELAIKTDMKMEKEIAKFVKTKVNSMNKNVEYSYEVAGVNIFYNHDSFIQSNLNQNMKLVETVVSKIDENDEVLFDMYSGIGNFSLPIAKKYPNSKIHAVELSTESFEMQLKNLIENSIENIACINQSTERFLKKNALSADCIILDPPRTGCGEAACRYLLNKMPKKLVYVSCNAKTMKEDLKMLLEHYEIKSIDLIDMFLYTEHFETVCVLERV